MEWLHLSRLLSSINQHTYNRMMVVSNVCFSLETIYPPRIAEPAPFAILVAPKSEVSNGVIEEKAADFYSQLFENDDTDQAIESVLPEYYIFITEKHLYKIVRGLVWGYSGRKGRSERERALTSILSDVPQGYKFEKSEIRKIIRDYKNKFDEDQLEKLIGVYMCVQRTPQTY